VVLCSRTDVAALGIENDRHAGMPLADVRYYALQGVFRALCGEVRDLRFEGADQIGRRIDDRAAELEHGIGLAAQRFRQARRFGIEADAEQRRVASLCCVNGRDEGHAYASFLYLTRCGFAASSPRRRFLSSSYSR